MKKNILVKEILLTLTTIIWGLGFIAQSIGGSVMDAFSFNVLRNVVATIFLFLLVIIDYFISKKKKVLKIENNKELLLAGFLIGLALALAMTFQQLGINSMGAGKSGFLTALYIVFIPIIGISIGRKIRLLSIVSVLVALVGLYLINIKDGDFSLSIGSIYLILCAFLYAIQIMLIDKFSRYHNSFRLTCFEFAFATILLVPFSLIFGTINTNLIKDAILPILFLGIFSSGIAYTMQIYAQKEVNVIVASIIMSLESVFSLIFGALFLKERFSSIELIGCMMIFIAVITAQIPTKVKKKKEIEE